MMKLICSLMLLVFLLPCAAARAGAPADTDLLRPYLDNQTLLVAHLDTAKIDFPAFDQFTRDALASAKLPDDDAMVRDIRAGSAAAKGFLEKFSKLGGRQVYMVVSQADLWPHPRPGAILMTLKPNGDAKAMADFVQAAMQLEKPAVIVALGKGLLFLGDEAELKRLQGMKPQPRPDLEAALAETPAAALQVIAAPTPDMRRALTELMPRLPQAAGGGPIDPLAQGVKWISVSVDLPPKPAITVRLVAQTPDEARVVAGLCGRAAGVATAAISSLPPDPLKPALAELLDDLKPQVAGSSVVVQVTSDQIKGFYSAMGIAFEKWRVLQGRQRDAANLHDIAQACIVWSAEHKGMLPDHLGRLLLNNQISPGDLVMVGSGTAPLAITPEMREKAKTDFAAFAKEVDAHCDVVYLGNGMHNAADSSVVVAYEKPGAYSGDLTMVYLDTHCEVDRLSDAAELFGPTNAYRKKMKLPLVDVDALLKAGGK